MRAPPIPELLDAWEHGLRQSPIHRVLTLLAAACPELTDEQLWQLSIGQRDAYLLELRKQLFGSQLTVVAPCTQCGEQLESSFEVDDIKQEAADSAAAYAIHGCTVILRAPSSRDFIALTADDAAASELLKRCVIDIRDANNNAVNIEERSDSFHAAVAATLGTLDPQADIRLKLGCPACANSWNAVFDIADFLWKEMHAWAVRTLRDVHRLARNYGWSEAQALALSPTRRQMYLELCRQ